MYHTKCRAALVLVLVAVVACAAGNLEKAAECYMAALNIRPNFPQVTCWHCVQ
jgi:hypothetical protein